MADRAAAPDDCGVKRGVLSAVAAVTLAATGVAADAARRAPTTFRLVFDGMHTPALLHEGPFTTSASFCSAGFRGGRSHRGGHRDRRAEVQVHRFCRRVHGSHQAGSCRARRERVVADRRGRRCTGEPPWKGNVDERPPQRDDGDPRTITYRSSWQGVVDFDVSPPATSVTKATARKLRKPKGAYQLTFALAFDEPAGNDVSYELTVIDPRTSLRTSKFGETSTGRASVGLRVRPTKRTRVLRVEIDASDPFGNTAHLTTTRRIR
jgi:hypothetical protein